MKEIYKIIIEIQIFLSRWVAFAKIHLEKEFSYEVLAEKLDDIDKIWANHSPSRKEVTHIAA